MQTVDEFAAEMALEFGEEYSDLDIADQFRRWVQEVYDEIISSSRAFFTNAKYDLSLASGTSEYVLNDRVSEVRDIHLSDTNTRVSYTPVERLIARGASFTTPGRPRAFFYLGLEPTTAMRIQVWPVPDQAYTAIVHALVRPARLADTDVIPLPEEYVRAMRDGVRARVRYNDGALQDYQAARGEFASAVAGLNQRFSALERPPSSLRVKRLRAIRQAPATPDGA